MRQRSNMHHSVWLFTIVAALLCCVYQSEAQITEEPVQILEFAEVMPEYPGGVEQMQRFVHQNLELSGKWTDARIKTLIFVEYVVETDGSVTNVKLMRETEYSELGAELIRVVKMFPRHTPGKQGDQLVRVRQRIPLKIELK